MTETITQAGFVIRDEDDPAGINNKDGIARFLKEEPKFLFAGKEGCLGLFP